MSLSIYNEFGTSDKSQNHVGNTNYSSVDSRTLQKKSHILFLLLVKAGYTSSPKNIELEVASQTLDCYCVCCELLSASIADALQFVNILVSGIFHGRFAQ